MGTVQRGRPRAYPPPGLPASHPKWIKSRLQLVHFLRGATNGPSLLSILPYTPKHPTLNLKQKLESTVREKTLHPVWDEEFNLPNLPPGTTIRLEVYSTPQTLTLNLFDCSRFNPCQMNQHPTPYTLQPTPYNLHTTPYNLHPTPYNLDPKPYTLNPAPCTLHPASYTLRPAPHPTSYILHHKP